MERGGYLVFHRSCAALTFWVAVSRVKGGASPMMDGGRGYGNW